jgi:hypothetical protein
MTTLAEATEAPRRCQKQRWDLRGLLRINPVGASADDLALARRVAAVPSPAEYDRALADRAVAALFHRGILGFRL